MKKPTMFRIQMKKSDRLIELVKGKTLLKEAPTRRDVILHVYGIDIEDPKTKEWTICFVRRKLTALMRSVRHREQKWLGLDSICKDNENQFYMIRDDNSVWRCVHIIDEMNGDYLVKYWKGLEKYEETYKRRNEKRLRIVTYSPELKQQLWTAEINRRRERNRKGKVRMKRASISDTDEEVDKQYV